MSQIISQIFKALLWFAPLSKSIGRIIKSIPAIVEVTEELWKDKKIDVSERKIIASKAVEIIARDANIRLNWLVRIAISIIIDAISQRLPARDINIKETMIEAVRDIKG